MKSVLFLTGNTPFHALERKATEISEQLPGVSFTVQSIAPIIKKRSNLLVTKFLPEGEFSEYDVIVTHVGAGTVFFLLGENIPFTAIPNLERTDQHQLELYSWLQAKRLARTVLVENLDETLILEDMVPRLLNVDLPQFCVDELMNELFPSVL